jgi:hypothetical protein
LITLTYLSTATTPFSVTDLAALLDSARESNRDAGLTGMLVYAGGHFVQTIEGAADAVDRTFARIERDTRHHDVTLARREDIAERAFPDWSMGFENLATEQVEALGRSELFDRVFRDRAG